MTTRTLHVRAEVHAAILGVLPSLTASDINEAVHLKDLGADSVDRVEIIMDVLHRLELREPMSTFNGLSNIGALIETLDRLCARTL